MGSFQPKNTQTTYSKLQIMDYLVQTIGLDSTGAQTVLSSLGILSPSLLSKRGEDGSSTPLQIGTGTANVKLYGYFLYNPNAVDVFLKIYSKASAPVVGTDTPITAPIQVPATGSAVINGKDLIVNAALKMWFAFTTGYASSDTGNPATAIAYQFNYA